MKKVLITFVLCVSSLTAFALPGDLDPTFGRSGGYVVSDLLDEHLAESPQDVAIQADGKIVIGGQRHISNMSAFDFLVVRYNADLTLDTSFSGDGFFTLNDTVEDLVNAIAIQPDGKIVAVGQGSSSLECYVFRLNTDGTLDTTFSGDGIYEVPNTGFGLSVTIQPLDNKIVVGAKGVVGQSTIFRLTTSGTLDTTFSGDGRVFLSPEHYFPLDIQLQSDGKIVAVGTDEINNFGVMSTVRLLADGTVDTTFDGDGYANTAPFAGESYAKSLMIQADGKIVVGGGIGDFGNSTVNAAMIRYNSNGSLDTTFDGDGILTFQFIEGGANYVNEIVQQADGKIVASVDTTYTLAGVEDFSLIRLNANGSFDGSFDANGLVQSQWCENGQDLLLQSDGKIVAVGQLPRAGSSNSGICTQRFETDGSVDYSVNFAAGNGRIIQPFTSIEAIAGLQNGKILVAGYSSVYDINGNLLRDLAILLRLNADGTLDTTFYDEGRFEWLNSSNSTYFFDLKIQPDGSFFVAGEGGQSGSKSGMIAKFTSAGVLDTTFSGDGVVVAGLAATRFYAIAIQPDGKVIGCGSSGQGAAPRNGKVARYSATGLLELDQFITFGIVNGSEVLECGLRSDGKLIAAGYGYDGTGENITISRLQSSNLAPELTFGTLGTVTTNMSPTLNDRATDMVVQPDDKFVISSTGIGVNGDRDLAVLRYDADGGLDPNFTENFGINGVSLIDFVLNAPNDDARTLALEPTGAVIVAGSSDDGTGEKFAISKLNSNGTLRLGWGTLGRKTLAFPNGDSRISALGYWIDGKVLAAGRAWNGTNYDFAIARYQNEGGPTAAEVSITGRVLTAGGNGIRNAVITLTSTNGTSQSVRTSSFGYFKFDGVESGATVVVSVSSKNFRFNPSSQVVNVGDKVGELYFIAEK